MIQLSLHFGVLAGNSEVGDRNCLILWDSKSGQWIMMDCGGSPSFDFGGKDEQKLDFRRFSLDPDSACSVVVTHGHYDHIAGLRWLGDYFVENESMRGKPLCPVYATRFTQGCIAHERTGFGAFAAENRKAWHAAEATLQYKVVSKPDVIIRKPFSFSFIPVDHTIPQSAGVMISYQQKGLRPIRVLNLGDFRLEGSWQKFKSDPNFQEPDVLVLDSSGAMTPGKTPPESDCLENISKIIRAHPRQEVVVALFSTNVDRAHAICEMHSDRRIEISGLSLERKTSLATGMDLYDFPTRFSNGSAKLRIVTGSQAEPHSQLYNIVYGRGEEKEHFNPNVVIAACARIIPKDENVRRVKELLECAHSNMSDKGRIYVNTNTSTEIGPYNRVNISSSGHCSEQDLLEVIDHIRPKLLIPVHGDKERRLALAAIAKSIGVASLCLEDGESAEI